MNVPTAPVAGLSPQDKKIVISGLILVSGVCWLYMFYMAWAMENMHLVDMWMPPMAGMQPWTAWDFFMLFFMWFSMMIAMMTPSVSPMVMMYTTVSRAKKLKQQPYAPTFIFLTGYLVAWALFSVFASAIQWPLHESNVLDPMMYNNSYLLSGAIILLAGIYQMTPMKDACLNQCRTPLGFLMAAWKDGKSGAFQMGLYHGMFCVGCCWALMAVLLAVGVMNMLWVLLIAVFVLIEKILPFSPTATRMMTGAGLVVWGGYWLSLHPW